ncbi:H-2 class II histocompatibility antigen, A-R alpha chain-like [Hyperolius riggenbachi]|uniref:H-2 class II histocompatibility antigen, A-R alpha chain-like n=1 Tax=Hyperolius riggenbachi TaxID=752182 RepID=UPI0035A34077
MKVLCFCALLVAGITAIQVDYFEFPAAMVQTQKPTGEYIMDYDGNERYHVDLDSKSVVWTLPGLEKYISFEVQGALNDINILKYNLDLLMKRSKYTPAVSVPPIGKVYEKHPIVLGEPNVLICAVSNIFPPVMNMTWLKNGEKVDVGVSETTFLPSQDHSFRKFLYLAFIPTSDDIYSCQVEHWGLEKPSRILWDPETPPVQSETAETVICAVGLFVGFIGIIVGAALIIKGMRLKAQRMRRGN